MLIPGLLTYLLTSAGSLSAPTEGLTIGSKAPPIKVAAWVKDTPVSSFAPGKVYVVDFWATWCGPCRRSFPILSAMAKKYAGKVVFAGVDAMEYQQNDSDATYIDHVRKFVKRQGEKMSYHVAVDGPKHSMVSGWLDAAGEVALPTAFIVDQHGRIAWIGSQPEALEEALGKIVTHQYDIGAAAAERKRERDAMRAVALAPPPAPAHNTMRDLVTAIETKNWPEAVSVCNRLFQEEPSQEFKIGPMKFLSLLQTDETAAYSYGRKLSKGLYLEAPTQLATLSEMVLSEEFGPKNPDTAFALTLARQSVACKGGQAPAFFDALANAEFRSGDPNQAIVDETKAFDLLRADTSLPPAIHDALEKQMSKHLSQFKERKN